MHYMTAVRKEEGRGDRRTDRRGDLVTGTLRYALEHGVSGLSLRPVAAALGTSDRMLVYYFGSRDALIAAVLEAAAVQLRDLVAAALPPRPLPPAQVVGLAPALLEDPGARAVLRLWLEVAGLAARGDPICAATARDVTDGWLAWLAERLDIPASERRAAAAGVLAVLDGLLLEALVGRPEAASAGATWLRDALA